MLAAASLCSTAVDAQTAAEDEARIEELIRRELALRGKPAAPAGEVEPAVVGGASAPIESAPVGGASAPTEAPPIEPAVVGGASAPIATPIGAEAPPTNSPAAEPPAEPTIFADMTPRDPAEIAIRDLAAHAGRIVRVRSVGGRTHVGRIESVGSDAVTLRIKIAGGYAMFDLSFAQIATVTRL